MMKPLRAVSFMISDRWLQIDKIYHAALERAPEERSAFLDGACMGDLELRREVDSLLASSGTWLDQPAVQARLPNGGRLLPGTCLGPYRIDSLLGTGGMGEVYRAEDTRLPRAVALKVSHQEFGERFEREARAVALLNHPNICTLYDVGPNFLVMELVEGPTLADRIKKGPVPLEEALNIAGQIAEALEAAHEKGIIHRDLKPANVKITPGGRVKVLDFGLAKHLKSATPDDSLTTSLEATKAGTILGTPAYMSPEQASGKPADKRADIWAFGVILYEMLTGRHPFQGGTLQEIISSVLKDTPDLDAVPAKVRRLLDRCLQKEPARRLRDAGDAMALIDDAPPPERPRPARWKWPAIMAGAVGLMAVAITWLQANRSRTPAAPVKLQICRRQ